MDTFGDRLRRERERLGLTQEAWGRLVGVKKNAQINYENNKRSPSGEYLMAARDAGADVTYILTGIRVPEEVLTAARLVKEQFGEVLDASDRALAQLDVTPEPASAPEVEIEGESFAAIPRYDARLAAGGGAVNHEGAATAGLAFRRDWLSRMGVAPASACIVTVTGDSMAPTLCDTDLVMIDRRRTAIRNRHVYAFVDISGEARVKRLELVSDRMIILSSDNPDFATEWREGEEMNALIILGEVVWSAHSWVAEII